MKDVKISLNTVDKVKSFVAKISTVEFDVDIICGRYVIDAKSIMGIFSIDLTRELFLHIHVDNQKDFDSVYDKIKEFVVND